MAGLPPSPLRPPYPPGAPKNPGKRAKQINARMVNHQKQMLALKSANILVKPSGATNPFAVVTSPGGLGRRAPDVYPSTDCVPYFENWKTGERIKLDTVQGFEIWNRTDGHDTIVLTRLLCNSEPLNFMLPDAPPGHWSFVIELRGLKRNDEPYMQITRCLKLRTPNVTKKRIYADSKDVSIVTEEVTIEGILEFQEIDPMEAWMQKRYPRYKVWQA